MNRLLKQAIFAFAISGVSYLAFAAEPKSESETIPNHIKSSQIRPTGNDYGGVYYDVACDSFNGSSTTFYATSVGTCYGYTNGAQTYKTPSTCYPSFRDPTLDEFNAQVGQPFCQLPAPNVKSSQVRPNDRNGVYYDVTCLNGSSTTFYPTSAGTCYSYTNGKQTYTTPSTCYPSFRDPTLDEFNAQVGQPFCLIPQKSSAH